MISILITHYNRIDALVSCMKAFKALNIQNVEYVVTDDNSEPYIKEQLMSLNLGKLIFSKRNTGLASNLNRGLKACSGDFILYCQEDFIPDSNLIDDVREALEILNSGQADMCRLKANYYFPQLYPLSNKFGLIPKFSFQNFYYNTFQYSDNPFITKNVFFKKYGYFLENVSGAYGENEYAIRIMKSDARIAISYKYPFISNKKSSSVIMHSQKIKKRKILKKIKVYRLLRAIRLHLEFLFYNKKKRKLYTIKNYR